MRAALGALAVVLASCRGPALGSADSGESRETTLDVFCLEQVEWIYDENDPYLHSSCTFLDKMADACEVAQPLLARAARDASCLPDEQRAVTLLRAARKHPAFLPECDIPDSEAAKPADEVFGTRKGCFGAERDCNLSAGTHVFEWTFLRVAARGRPRYFDDFDLTEFQCSRRRRP